MQVSAVTPQYSYSYVFNANMQLCDNINDTSFNSLAPLNSKKSVPQDDLKQVYLNITEWKDFCHKQIMSEQFDVIA